MFSLICARIHCWVNNREAGDFRRYRAHYDVIVMSLHTITWSCTVRAKTTRQRYSNNPFWHGHTSYIFIWCFLYINSCASMYVYSWQLGFPHPLSRCVENILRQWTVCIENFPHVLTNTDQFCMCSFDQGWGLLCQFSPFCYFPIFSEWSKQWSPTCMISSSSLAGVTEAELRRHLPNMNMIEITWLILSLNQNFPPSLGGFGPQSSRLEGYCRTTLGGRAGGGRPNRWLVPDFEDGFNRVKILMKTWRCETPWSFTDFPI